jgi:acylphosphatase
MRHPDSARELHQPIVVPVPALPGPTPQRALVTDGAAPARLTAWLHGRVQGVGMRWWVRSRALELGLDGWARNLADGRVEVVAEGAEPACRALLAMFEPAGRVASGDGGERGGERRPGRIGTVVERWSSPVGVGPGFVER